jgi:DNA-directed RNA polymerase sigma subunit (sigma70/sigma32)
MSQEDGALEPDDQAAADERESGAVGAEAEFSHRQRALVRHALISRLSPHGFAGENEDINLEEDVADSHDPLQEEAAAEMAEQLNWALGQLTAVEAWFLRRRFGLDDPHTPPSRGRRANGDRTVAKSSGAQGWSLRRISRTLRISLRQVRRLERKALAKLRDCLKSPTGI